MVATLLSLEHHRPTAFATQVAVRSRVKGVAPSANRRHARQRRAHVSAGVQYCVRPNSKSEWALVMLHATPRGMHGDQARRAGRVKHHARAAHREHVRQARAGRRVGDTSHVVGTRHAWHEVLGVHVHHAREDARVRVYQRRAVLSLPMERLIAHFEQHALLRLQRPRLGRRDAEHGVVEHGEVALQERAVPHATARVGREAARVDRVHVPARRGYVRSGLISTVRQAVEVTVREAAFYCWEAHRGSHDKAFLYCLVFGF
mmetsp:Transcript_7952/g.22336  ORF Transcript_7952/g.22336 Transcript_7952/m.22336 type:complete len:260 (+) Transcript_7952:2339-3118(+)